MKHQTTGLARLLEYYRCAKELGTSGAARKALYWALNKNVLVRLGLKQHHPDQVYTIPTVFGDLSFRDNRGDITNLFKILYQEEYNVRALRHPGVILDIGANIGMAAAWFARFNPDRKIYCFEPLEGNARLVEKNCPVADVVRAAAGAQRGEVTLDVDPDGMMASSLGVGNRTNRITFPVVTLDAFAAERDLTAVGMLKMDAEGMEVEILRGARNVLARTGQIVMETHGLDRHEGALALLREAGFGIDENRFEGSTGVLAGSRPRAWKAVDVADEHRLAPAVG